MCAWLHMVSITAALFPRYDSARVRANQITKINDETALDRATKAVCTKGGKPVCIRHFHGSPHASCCMEGRIGICRTYACAYAGLAEHTNACANAAPSKGWHAFPPFRHAEWINCCAKNKGANEIVQLGMFEPSPTACNLPDSWCTNTNNKQWNLQRLIRKDDFDTLQELPSRFWVERVGNAERLICAFYRLPQRDGPFRYTPQVKADNEGQCNQSPGCIVLDRDEFQSLFLLHDRAERDVQVPTENGHCSVPALFLKNNRRSHFRSLVDDGDAREMRINAFFPTPDKLCTAGTQAVAVTVKNMVRGTWEVIKMFTRYLPITEGWRVVEVKKIFPEGQSGMSVDRDGRVTMVMKDSAAEKLGVMAGWLIQAINPPARTTKQLGLPLVFESESSVMFKTIYIHDYSALRPGQPGPISEANIEQYVLDSEDEWSLMRLTQQTALHLAEIKGWFVDTVPDGADDQHPWLHLLNHGCSVFDWSEDKPSRHQRTVKYPDGNGLTQVDNGKPCLTTLYIRLKEYVAGNLREYIREKTVAQEREYANSAESRQDRAKFALKTCRDILSAVFGLQASGRAHLDMKPDNIFFDNVYAAYVGDFGQARMYLSNGKNRNQDFYFSVNSQVWAGPEVDADLKFDHVKSKFTVDKSTVRLDKSDVYATGLLLRSMLLAETGEDKSSIDRIRQEITVDECRGHNAGPDELLAVLKQLTEIQRQRLCEVLIKMHAGYDARWNVYEAIDGVQLALDAFGEQTNVESQFTLFEAAFDAFVASAKQASNEFNLMIPSSDTLAVEYGKEKAFEVFRECLQDGHDWTEKQEHRDVKQRLIACKIQMAPFLWKGHMCAVNGLDQLAEGVGIIKYFEDIHVPDVADPQTSSKFTAMVKQLGGNWAAAEAVGFLKTFGHFNLVSGFEVGLSRHVEDIITGMIPHYRHLMEVDEKLWSKANNNIKVGIVDVFNREKYAAQQTEHESIDDLVIKGDLPAMDGSDHGNECIEAVKLIAPHVRVYGVTSEHSQRDRALAVIIDLNEQKTDIVSISLGGIGESHEDVIHALVTLARTRILIFSAGNKGMDLHTGEVESHPYEMCSDNGQPDFPPTLAKACDECMLIFAVNYANSLKSKSACSNFPGASEIMQGVTLAVPAQTVPVGGHLQGGSSEAAPEIAGLAAVVLGNALAVPGAQELDPALLRSLAYKALMQSARKDDGSEDSEVRGDAKQYGRGVASASLASEQVVVLVKAALLSLSTSQPPPSNETRKSS